MDQEYLQNIAGSPYIEGIEERLGARVKSGLKNFGAVVGSGALESREYTYVRSALKKFQSELKDLLEEFVQNSDRLKYSKPSPNEQQLYLIDKLIELEGMFNPTTFQAHQYNKMQSRNITGDPIAKKSHIGGIQGSMGGKPDPKKHWDAWKNSKSVSESSTLQDLVKESVFNRFSSEINKAWYSRDINKILAAYINAVRSITKSFYSEVKKFTGMDANGARKIIKDVEKSSIGILDKAEAVVSDYDSQLQTGSDINMPVGATPKGMDIGPDPDVSEKPSISPMVPPKNQSEPKTSSPTSSAIGPDGNINLSKNDYAAIVLKAMNIIIDAVQSDTAHAEPFLGPKQQDLPKNWGDPDLTTEMTLSHLLKEIEEDETPEDPPSPENIVGDEEVSYVPGEFLYNFASKNRKYPSNFSIEVVPVHESTEIEIPVGSGNIMDIKVIWNVEKQKNDIYVKLTDKNTGATTTQLIFRAMTHQINPKVDQGGTTFDIKQILQQAHSMTFKGDPLEGADPTIVQQIIAKSQGGLSSPFGRALYAASQRRSMEFKPKKKSKRRLTFDGSGSVIDTSSGKPETYTKDQIGALLNSDPETSAMWTKDLQNIGYFDSFPDMKPKSPEQYEPFKQAVLALQNTMGAEKALKSVKNAWIKLRTEMKKAPTDIHLMDILKIAGYSAVVAKADAAGKTPSKDWPENVDPLNVGVISPVLKFDKTNGIVFMKQADGTVKQFSGFPEWGTLNKDFQDSLKKAGYPLEKIKGYTPAVETNPEEKPDEKSPIPEKSKQEQALANVNKALESAGIEPLISIKAGIILNALKGNWNAQKKKQYQEKGDDSILKLIVGKTPPEGSIEVWKALVSKANAKAKAKDYGSETPKKDPKSEPTTERINPFQRDNFLF